MHIHLYHTNIIISDIAQLFSHCMLALPLFFYLPLIRPLWPSIPISAYRAFHHPLHPILHHQSCIHIPFSMSLIPLVEGDHQRPQRLDDGRAFIPKWRAVRIQYKYPPIVLLAWLCSNDCLMVQGG